MIRVREAPEEQDEQIRRRLLILVAANRSCVEMLILQRDGLDLCLLTPTMKSWA